MAYHYGDTPAANPITHEDDVAYMAKRWLLIAEQAALIVIDASLISLNDDQRAALDVATAWRYDIGEHRIECLFHDPDAETRFRELEAFGDEDRKSSEQAA